MTDVAMTETAMLPAGYMLKKVVARPDWLKVPEVDDIYSLSGCVSADFTDYINYWRHNGFWLFDNPGLMTEIAAEEGIDLSSLTLFYYEVFPRAFDRDARAWTTIAADPSFTTEVVRPPLVVPAGYDVVTFYAGSSAECSPLSCNHLASKITVNRHCLFASLEAARAALEAGLFDNSEPGPCRIFAVHHLGSANSSAVTPAGTW